MSDLGKSVRRGKKETSEWLLEMCVVWGQSADGWVKVVTGRAVSQKGTEELLFSLIMQS